VSVLIPVAVAAALLPAAFFMLWRRRNLPEPGKVPVRLPSLSVIIPARNEAASLPLLLADLARQTLKPGEILVVDDASTDATSRLARAGGARVLRLPKEKKPIGWNGKSFACHSGVAKARGSLLLLLDADVRLAPDSLASLCTLSRERPLAAFCVQPRHDPASTREQLSAALNVLVLSGTNAFTPLGEAWPPSGAFGPCLWISKKDYQRCGGHGAVRGEILDNLPLGKNIVASGIPLVALQGGSRVRYRMYPGGWKEQNQGWSKSLATGASFSHPAMSIVVGLWITGALCAFGALGQALTFGAHRGPALVCYGAWVLALWRQFRRAGNFHPLLALCYPFPFAYLLLMQAHSIWMLRVRKRVVWRGRLLPAKGDGR